MIHDVPAAAPLASRRARIAVGALFATNGAAFASLVPRYPDLKDDLGLSNTALGAAVSAFWLGALVVGLLAGTLVARWGSGRVAWAATVSSATVLVLVGLAPSVWALAVVLFALGAADSVADVAENAQSLRIERSFGRSILNSLHAVWSIGAVFGGLVAAAAARSQTPVVLHLSAAAVVFVLVALAASRHLLPGPDPLAPQTPGTQPVDEWRMASRPARRRRLRRTATAVLVLGVVATLAQAIEDTGSTWSGVYLRDELAAGAGLAGLAFVALQGMQTVGRLLGDRVVTRYGDVAPARVGAGVAGTAMTTALLLPHPVTTVAAFGLVGLGIATLVPASMRAADGLPGLRPGTGLTLVGSVVRVGAVLAAPGIGLTADAVSLRAALGFVPVAAVVVILLAGSLRPMVSRRHVG